MTIPNVVLSNKRLIANVTGTDNGLSVSVGFRNFQVTSKTGKMSSRFLRTLIEVPVPTAHSLKSVRVRCHCASIAPDLGLYTAVLIWTNEQMMSSVFRDGRTEILEMTLTLFKDSPLRVWTACAINVPSGNSEIAESTLDVIDFEYIS